VNEEFKYRMVVQRCSTRKRDLSEKIFSKRHKKVDFTKREGKKEM
jgi:hypothetical protein